MKKAGAGITFLIVSIVVIFSVSRNFYRRYQEQQREAERVEELISSPLRKSLGGVGLFVGSEASPSFCGKAFLNLW